MFTFFWFLICMVYMFLPDCERLIFFLMLVFDVFFLFAAVTTTFVCTCLAYLPAQRERKAILWYVCLFAHSHRKSTQEHYHLISCASLYFMYMQVLAVMLFNIVKGKIILKINFFEVCEYLSVCICRCRLFYLLLLLRYSIAFAILLTDVISSSNFKCFGSQNKKSKMQREKNIIRTSATHRFNVMLGCYYKKIVIDILCLHARQELFYFFKLKFKKNVKKNHL